MPFTEAAGIFFTTLACLSLRHQPFMSPLSSDKLKQYGLLAAILLLIYVLGRQLFLFIPSMLGAATLYILLRQWYFRLTVVHNWKKWLTATVFIIGSIVVFVLPFFFLAQALLPKFTYFLSNANQFNEGLDAAIRRLNQQFPSLNFDVRQLRGVAVNVANSAPKVLGAAGNIFTNLVLTFFLLYFMLVDGRRMERAIQKFLPLKEENIHHVWQATRIMVVSNAIGIPVLAAAQALVAMLGYYLFGIEEFVLWGIVTGLFSVIPIVGSAIVWIPLCIFLFASGDTGKGVGLLIYCAAVTSNIDNVLRFSLLKKLGDVHPIITVLGIIVGIPLFGFMGFIFGPLLISYLLLLIQIYQVEFSDKAT